MFWNKKQSANENKWHEAPGCFERHLQRRHNNPLFSGKRRLVSLDELTEARKKDDEEQKDFKLKYEIFLRTTVLLTDEDTVSRVSSQDLIKCLRDTQGLLERAGGIGGNLTKEMGILEKTEGTLINLLNSRVPDGDVMLEQTKSLSIMKRIPFFAQLTRTGSPILKDEQIPSILSEGLETVKLMGYISRKITGPKVVGFSMAPDFRPNSDDIKEFLEEAVDNGFSNESGQKLMDAWNSQKI